MAFFFSLETPNHVKTRLKNQFLTCRPVPFALRYRKQCVGWNTSDRGVSRILCRAVIFCLGMTQAIDPLNLYPIGQYHGSKVIRINS